MKKLPALIAETKSMIVSSNFDDFKAEADIFLDSINTDLTEPADFVQAKATIKNCKEVETNIQKALDKIIEESGDVGVLIKSMEDIKKRFANVRLELTPKVAEEEKTIKKTATDKAKSEIEDFVVCLNRVVEPFGLTINFDVDKLFSDAIKGKRTSKSVDKALKDAVFELKKEIQANADTIMSNYKWYIENIGDSGFLFSDIGMLVDKPFDDFKQIVTGRINSHKLAEAGETVELPKSAMDQIPEKIDDEILLDSKPPVNQHMPQNEMPSREHVPTVQEDVNPDLLFIDTIREWYDTQRRADRLRAHIIDKMNPFAQPGETSFELTAGYKLVYTGKEERTIDMGNFELVKSTLQQNGINPNDLFFYMPMVSNTYGSLSPEIKEWIDSQCMTITLEHDLKVIGPDE